MTLLERFLELPVGGRVALLLLAVFSLNTSLTFQNVWPSLWVRPTLELSVELLALLLALAFVAGRRTDVGRWGVPVVSIILVLLILGRYADVTSHALFGRPINLYFDLQHLPRVVAMTAGARSPLEIGGFAVVIFFVAMVLWFSVRLGVGTVAACLADKRLRRSAAIVGVVGLVIFGVGRVGGISWINHRFALPVSPVYAEQAAFVVEAAFGAGSPSGLAEAPIVSSDLARLEGGDAFVLFFESYGAIAYEEPTIASVVRPRVDRLQRRLASGRWRVVSGYFTAPTFGGASWLSHSSLLSGISVSRNRDYQLLLSSARKTMLDTFRGAGYRTVALMPGIKRAWPEGDYYKYDKIYDAAAIGYRGPAFGWWTIPDQASLEALYRSEIAAQARRPVFAVFPTIMSHLPFEPRPPYLADWSTVRDGDGYDAPDGAQRDGEMGDWRSLRRSYRLAISHNFDLLDGFLHQRAPADALVIVLGDHQPPAIVSGSGSTWTVPVHVFSHREEILARFQRRGLKEGLLPIGRSLGKLSEFHRIILEALDSREFVNN